MGYIFIINHVQSMYPWHFLSSKQDFQEVITEKAIFWVIVDKSLNYSRPNTYYINCQDQATRKYGSSAQWV